MLLPIKKAIAEAVDDREMRRQAHYYYAEAIPRLVDEDFARNILHVSDLSACSLAIALRLSGEKDVIDWQTQLAKFDDGAHSGAYNAALAKVWLEKTYPELECRVEFPCTYRSLTGHIDLSTWIRGGGRCVHVTEFKKTHFAAAIEDPTVRRQNGDSNRHFVLQAACYAIADETGAPDAAVVVYAPSAPSFDFKAKEYITPSYLEQFDYDPEEWREEIDAQVDRVLRAAAVAPNDVPCDPNQKWMPRLCRYPSCRKKVSHAAR